MSYIIEYHFGKRVAISYWAKPIPVRDHDWIAWIDGEEEVGVYGYGSTKREALDDLHMLMMVGEA